MIIQTGMRTDIPAFYSEWLMNRIQEGFVLVRNPYNPTQVTKYSLSPEVVDLIAFCTKNPAPMLPFMEQLTPYGQYWFVTITPYGPEIEPHVPPKAQVLQDFITLSKAEQSQKKQDAGDYHIVPPNISPGANRAASHNKSHIVYDTKFPCGIQRPARRHFESHYIR